MIKRLKKDKTKMLSGILSLFLVCVCFVINGCVPALLGGDWISDLNDQLENGEISQEEYDDMFKENSGGIELEGIKVLRRPSIYDYDANVTESNYYKQLSNDIFVFINKMNGIVDYDYSAAREEPKEGESEGAIIVPGANIFDALSNVENSENTNLNNLASKYSNGDDNFKYFYDTLRYQITGEELMYVPKWKKDTIDQNGKVSTEYSNAETCPDNFQLNTTAVNEATLADNNISVSSISPSAIEVTADLNKGWNWFKSIDGKGYSTFNYKYNEDVDLTAYFYSIDFSLNEASLEEERENSGIVKNIIKPQKMNYADINQYFIDLGSTNYTSKVTKEDFSYALGYAIYCIVLGLNPNEIGWVNGVDAEGNVTSEFVVSGYEKVTGVDDQGNPKVEKSSAQVAFEDIKELFEKNGSYVGLTTRDKKNISNYILKNVIGSEALSYGVQNLYYEDIIPAIVDYCGKLTKVGQSQSESTDVGSNFVASEIIDYTGTSFFVSQNENDEFEFINSFEYQSLLIMPKREANITDIWLDFQYIARDGAIVLDDKELYLDITVSVNWWTGAEMKIIQETIRVYNNSFDPGETGSTLMFEFDSKVSAGGFGEPVKVGKFECDEIDVSKSEYKIEDEHTGLDKLILTGATDARLYYQLVQNGGENETGNYGAYGKLNNEKISSEHPDMSYLEITFDVAKVSGDFSKNYDFYVGFSQFNDYEPDYSELP